MRRPGVRVLYVSPLKALVYDIERNLRAPLVGIAPRRRAARAAVSPARRRGAHRRHAAARAPAAGAQPGRDPGHDARVAVPDARLEGARDAAHGRDRHRRRDPRAGADQARRAPGAVARAPGRADRRGAAAHRPVGDRAAARRGRALPRRRARGRDRRLLGEAAARSRRSRVPVPDMENPPAAAGAGAARRLDPRRALRARGRHAAERARHLAGDLPASCWRAIRANRSTIIFVNSRGLCERLAQRSTSWPERSCVRAHHGSVSHDKRAEIEEGLKSGAIRGIVATSSLELGIDMGAVDLVLLVESPGFGRARPAARRARRSPGRRGQRRAHLPEVPRRPARVRGRRRAHARGRARGDRGAAKRARRAGAADRRDVLRRTDDGRRDRARGRAGLVRTASCRAACSRPCSTCSPGATRRPDFADLRPLLSWDRSQRRAVAAARRGAWSRA